VAAADEQRYPARALPKPSGLAALVAAPRCQRTWRTRAPQPRRGLPAPIRKAAARTLRLPTRKAARRASCWTRYWRRRATRLPRKRSWSVLGSTLATAALVRRRSPTATSGRARGRRWRRNLSLPFALAPSMLHGGRCLRAWAPRAVVAPVRRRRLKGRFPAHLRRGPWRLIPSTGAPTFCCSDPSSMRGPRTAGRSTRPRAARSRRR
jgi:hypothetical protein